MNEDREHVVALVMDALMGVIDPELDMNVVDLGLVYSVEVGDASVKVELGLTSPTCPLGDWLQAEAERAAGLAVAPEGASVRVELVNDPPWTPQRMSPRAKAELGW